MGRVFFLGAGATKADFPNAPLNDDLLPGMLSIDSLGLENSKMVVRDFLREFFNITSENNLPRIEDVLSFLDSNLSYKKFFSKGYGFEQFQKVRRELVYLMGTLFEGSLKDNAKGVTSKFCQDPIDEDVVISTNYDIVIDNELRGIRSNINYGERIRGSGQFSENCTIFDDTTYICFTEDRNEHYLNNGRIELLKLHGSLNFLYCPKCKETDITIEQKGIIYCMRKNFDVKCINPHCTGKYVDLIVTPTYFKIYDNPFLEAIWQRAETAISKATELIFIGYSIPDADVEIRCMLLRGLARNSNKIKLTAVDVDKTGILKKRYQRLFGDINYIDNGFEGYLNNPH